MKWLGWMSVLICVSCSLGEVVRQEQRPPQYVILGNVFFQQIGGFGPTVSDAIQYDGTLLTGKPFSLSLRFDDYARYFYPGGGGRKSPVGHYQVDWSILAPGGSKNLLLSPLASFTGVKVNHHFIALQRDLKARDTEDLPTEALLYLKILTPGPPYLPEGDYTINANVTDGELDNPKILHRFSREVSVRTPLHWRNGSKVFFRVHLSSTTFELGDEQESSSVVVNGLLEHTIDPPANAVQRFVTIWGWRLDGQANVTLKLSNAPAPAKSVKFVALSSLPSSSPPALSVTATYPAESSALTAEFDATQTELKFSTAIHDDYQQVALGLVSLRLAK